VEGVGRLAVGVSTGLSRAAGRKFGLTLGIAFLVLGGILWWRDRETAAAVAGSLGTLLGLAGLVIPTRLGPVERAWMGLAHAIAKVTTPIFLGIVYFVTIAPIGLVMRALGRNPMVHAERDQGFWITRQQGADSSRMHRQF